MDADFGILTASARPDVLGGNRANFARLCRAADRLGLSPAVFNVGPDRRWQCFAYDRLARRFYPKERTVPKTLYNRIPTRKLESRPVTKWRVDEWVKAGVTITNPRFLHKDELAEIWQSDGVLRTFVPKTVRLQTPDDVWRFLEDGAVYLKPVDGKAGAGILRVRRAGRACEVIRQCPGSLRREIANERALTLWLTRNATRYVVQREVETARWQGRKFDLRMLFHADPESGRFSLTGAGVRAGKGGAITTHVPNGGMLADAPLVLSAVFGSAAGRQVMRRAEEVAQHAAERVAAGLPGTWCELSLDVGLLPGGEPRLFEANSKPMKFDEPIIERRAKQRLVAFLAAQ